MVHLAASKFDESRQGGEDHQHEQGGPCNGMGGQVEHYPCARILSGRERPEFLGFRPTASQADQGP
jgi:hypothetical protein